MPETACLTLTLTVIVTLTLTLTTLILDEDTENYAPKDTDLVSSSEVPSQTALLLTVLNSPPCSLVSC